MKVVPFPLGRRAALVRRQALWFVERTHEAAEGNLQRQLQVQKEALERRGIDPDTIQAELTDLEGAIRGEVWRLTFSAGGAA